MHATTVADLYSQADWFVERVAFVLKSMGITPEQRWQDEDPAERIAQLRIQCQKGIVTATTGQAIDGTISILPGESEDDVSTSIAAIQAAIAELGGPVLVDIPPEG